ncbi:MAG: hypothetical protein ACK4FR_07430 [Tabrizicola sp.]
MHSQIAAQLLLRGDLLLAGRIGDLLDCYIYPLPVFLPTGRLLLAGPNEARAALSLLRHALLQGGVGALRPQVRAVELPRAGRFRVWVDWHELPQGAGPVRESSAIYYCRGNGPGSGLGLQTEMVNYTRLSMPDLAQQFEALALSA